MAEQLTLVFVAKGIEPIDVIEVARRLFVKHGIPQQGFDLNGDSFELELSNVATRVKKRKHQPFEIEGQDFTIGLAGIGGTDLWRSSVKTEWPRRVPWDEWVIELINESFISAWVADADYEFWQNAEDLLSYKVRGRPWEHLPMRSNGLPPPLEQTVVDISHNPARRVFHADFVEAIGAVMWLGERFWQLSGSSKQRVLSEPWLQCTEIAAGLTRVQAAAECFSTDQGEAGDLQRKLRALLFHS